MNSAPIFQIRNRVTSRRVRIFPAINIQSQRGKYERRRLLVFVGQQDFITRENGHDTMTSFPKVGERAAVSSQNPLIGDTDNVVRYNPTGGIEKCRIVLFTSSAVTQNLCCKYEQRRVQRKHKRDGHRTLLT